VTSERRVTEIWERYLYSGQEWLISYICAPGFLESVKPFSIGHAFELHLKAVHVKILGDEEKCLKVGHNILLLWDEIKAADPTFLSSIEFRKRILTANFLEHGLDAEFFQEDWPHFVQYNELYIVAKHLAEMKYFGTPLRKRSGPMQYGWSFPNPMWLNILQEIRRFLGKTQESALLARLKESEEVSTYSMKLLERALGELQPAPMD
jgi:hypothetical protein